MNILFHCVYFPPEVGGLESHVYYLARALVNKGHRIQVVTSPLKFWQMGYILAKLAEIKLFHLFSQLKPGSSKV